MVVVFTRRTAIHSLGPAFQGEETRTQPNGLFIKPGFGLVPKDGGKLWTVAGSGIAVTIFDRRRNQGGMTHYLRPVRMPDLPSTTWFAAPAIVWLVSCFLQEGSQVSDLEAQVFGGAERNGAPRYIPQLHQQNVQVGLEILEKKGIPVAAMDVGGSRGRKVVFDCDSGESAVLRVDRIRDGDWYPLLSMEEAPR